MITLVVTANKRATQSPLPPLCNLRSGDGKHTCPMLRKSANKCRRRGQTDEEKGKQMMRKKATIDAKEEGQ